MDNQYDIAIIGGGASGLGLLYAMHLQGILKDYRVLLIESELKNSNDRTWSFWTDSSDPAWQMFGSCVSKTWTHLDSSHTERQNMDPYKYAQIRSKDFYAFVQDALHSYPNLEQVRAKVEKLIPGSVMRLQVSNGEVYKAKKVFDSRPPQIQDPELIWQSFVGYRIKTSASFETDVCRLMDFSVPQSEGLQFMYLLPTAEDEALVEFTRFGVKVLQEEESLSEINDYLAKMGITEYDILEKEIDKIPMSLVLNSKKKYHPKTTNYIPIGVRAGVVKASTGFAFKKIADHSWNLAIALKQGTELPLPGHRQQSWIYDELLLNLFHKEDNPIPKIFIRLFEVHPIDRILRFLDERSSFAEDLKIMYNMPWMPFFWSIGRSVGKRIGVR